MCGGLFQPDQALSCHQGPRKTTIDYRVPKHRSHNGANSCRPEVRFKSAGDSS